jgi:hypothetical protein
MARTERILLKRSFSLVFLPSLPCEKFPCLLMLETSSFSSGNVNE